MNDKLLHDVLRDLEEFCRLNDFPRTVEQLVWCQTAFADSTGIESRHSKMLGHPEPQYH